MKKKILIAFLAAVAGIILIFGLSGCYPTPAYSYEKDDGVLFYSGSVVVCCVDENATEIIIPETVTYYNFYGSEEKVDTFKIKRIAEFAFHGHKNLERIVIPKTVESIAPTAFAGCEKLKSIEIAHENPVYHSAGNNVIETDSATLIAGCIASVIPADGSVTKIGASAFKEFASESLTLPETITEIGEYAFYSSNLVSFTIPASVTVIGDNAFGECLKLGGITVKEENASFSGYDGIVYNKEKTQFVAIPKGLSGSITIAESITEIPELTFKDCKKIIALTIPDTVERIGAGALAGCAGLESITLPLKIKDTDSKTCKTFGYLFGENMYFDGAVKITQNYHSYNYTFYIPQNLTSVTVTDGEVVTNAFENCTTLKNVVLGEKIKTVGQAAFYKCTALESIITEGVEIINGLAFESCTALKRVVIADTYQEGVNNVFMYCGTLEEITMPASALYLFGSQKNFKKLTVTGEIIPFYQFRDCLSIEEVVIADSVTAIENGAFSGCNNLKSVELGNSLTRIGSFAFPAPNTGALEYTLYDNAYYLGTAQNPHYFLAKCTNSKITACEIHPETRIIGSSAFVYCEELNDVEIPQNVMTIEYRAFYGCYSIEELSLPQGLKIIGEGALCNCIKLSDLFIPSTVELIDDYAIQNCKFVAKIYYEGTEEQLKEICVGDKNFTTDLSTSLIKVYYYSPDKPEEEGLFWYYDNGEIAVWTNE